MLEIVRQLTCPITNLWNEESNSHQRVRRLAIFFGWQVWKRLVRKPITVTLFNQVRFLAHPDCQVSAAVLYFRIPNSRNILFLREHLSGGTLIDVGANVGSLSLLLSDRVQHAILFEPNPLAAARARENLARNQLAFEVCELALSDATGEVPFECHGGVDTVSRVLVNARPGQAGITVVPRITFDEFLVRHGSFPFPVSLVKIDVEGHENSVLRGMRQFLLERRPPLLMFEYLQRTNLDETIKFFGEVGYQVFELTKKGPLAVNGPVEPLQDLFACPHERMPAMGVATVAP